MEIAPIIPKTKRVFPPLSAFAEIEYAILRKLKTGLRWNQLPIKSLFEKDSLKWNTVYYYYRKWCLTEILKKIWIAFVNSDKKEPDLTSTNLESSHTPAIRGCEQVEYRGRKKRKGNSQRREEYFEQILYNSGFVGFLTTSLVEQIIHFEFLNAFKVDSITKDFIPPRTPIPNFYHKLKHLEQYVVYSQIQAKEI